MNKYELTCRYCNFSWQINYAPRESIYCTKCKDSNIKVIDIAREKVDYYIGCPPFKEDEEEVIAWHI